LICLHHRSSWRGDYEQAPSSSAENFGVAYIKEITLAVSWEAIEMLTYKTNYKVLTIYAEQLKALYLANLSETQS
jgi:hypothetical protein